MQMIHAVILGIVEGVTEFLPISSTGHMMLAGKLMNLEQTEFLKSFEVAIQLGAILSVVVLYRKKIFKQRTLFWKIMAAFIPTAILGALLYRIVKTYLLSSVTVVLWSLLIGGIAIIAFERIFQKKKDRSSGPANEIELENITYRQCAYVGLFQSLAMIPGVSRSAATIIGGMSLGISRKAIVEFSFLLAVPTMCAATGLDLLKSSCALTSRQYILLSVGFFFAFVTAMAAIKFFIKFVQNNSFVSFGIYRIVLSIIFWALFLK